ncbi:derlin-1-like [Mercenaria mercenaria]|uniref:derlin-1-like n=1 Tax=Mercenaria mercenaria TaxID=6596 RepID=UPI00234E5C40|nr:derlin-1-like [Mercenaria mercenaria]
MFIHSQAMCLPWIYVTFDIIVDHRSPVIALSGVIVGHVYFFLMFKYPLDFGGVRLLYAPRILYKYFPNRRERMAWFGQAPASLRRSSDDQDEHRWGGRGHILGGN